MSIGTVVVYGFEQQDSSSVIMSAAGSIAATNPKSVTGREAIIAAADELEQETRAIQKQPN